MQTKQPDTLARIMDGAARVFAMKGFAGASVDAIAGEAGVNKAAIYYHVGGKEVLYARVLQEIIGRAAALVVERTRGGKEPVQALTLYVSALWEAVERLPHLPFIITRALSESGQGGAFTASAADLAILFGELSRILDQGVEQGVFRPANPLVMGHMILSSLALFSNVRAGWEREGDLANLMRDAAPALVSRLEKNLTRDAGKQAGELIVRAVRL